MSNSSHRIRRLRWMVSTGSLAEAFTIRKCLYEQWQDLLLSACEKAFDEAVNGEKTMHIAKLELHLKVTSEQELMEVLPELIQQQLKEQLQSINWETISIAQPEFVWREATVQQTHFEILLHYLHTGSVPWQTANAATSKIASELKETSRKEQSQLVNYLANQPETAAFYFRLLQLLPKAEFFALVNALSDRFLKEWKTAISEFIRFVLDTGDSRLNQPTQWQLVAAILSECLSRSEQHISSDFSTIVAKILAEAGSDQNAFFSSLPATVSLLFQSQLNYDSSSTTAANLLAIENQKISANDGYLEKTNSPELDRNNYSEIPNEVKELPVNLNLNPDSLSLSENGGEPSHQEAILSDRLLNSLVEIASIGDEFPLSVNYAGLVLLHPFISPFFEATGVKETDSKTIAPSQMARAAALLHFLATEQEELYEYELGLIKILLGLEPETPLLVGEGLLQESDREEAEAVLQSTINYWTVLRNTSIDGLRSSFLQRSGLLRKIENGGRLQVEHQSFDMLLEHLPWSISIIKLSWMKQPLYTEWQTF